MKISVAYLNAFNNKKWSKPDLPVLQDGPRDLARAGYGELLPSGLERPCRMQLLGSLALQLGGSERDCNGPQTFPAEDEEHEALGSVPVRTDGLAGEARCSCRTLRFRN